jgi:hypothetical protein
LRGGEDEPRVFCVARRPDVYVDIAAPKDLFDFGWGEFPDFYLNEIFPFRLEAGKEGGGSLLFGCVKGGHVESEGIVPG